MVTFCHPSTSRSPLRVLSGGGDTRGGQSMSGRFQSVFVPFGVRAPRRVLGLGICRSWPRPRAAVPARARAHSANPVARVGGHCPGQSACSVVAAAGLELVGSPPPVPPQFFRSEPRVVGFLDPGMVAGEPPSFAGARADARGARWVGKGSASAPRRFRRPIQ